MLKSKKPKFKALAGAKKELRTKTIATARR